MINKKQKQPRNPSSPQPDRGHDMLSPRELAYISGMGQSAVYQLIREGSIPSIQVGKKFYIPRPQYQRWLEEISGACAGPLVRRKIKPRPKKLRLLPKQRGA